MTQTAVQVSTNPPLPGLSAVQQINNALATIATDFAGGADPASLAGPHMTWADIANSLLKRRNAANTAWVTLSDLYPRALQADVNARTNDVRFVTPAGLGGGISINLAANGHLKLPDWEGGLQICWGNPTTSAGGGIAVSFSRAFAQAPFSCVASLNANSGFAINITSSASATTGTFFANNSAGLVANTAFFFIAIGRG
ncbi:gp53-like domain-containing protein [Schauerella aestuarii]|uniref:gp53-like domain-containing protein n=1 Tax=Schauerella aestuarii TaxID=2511204 RepID=UPI00136F2723|nr:hypothetical protein [Achromobacter aestuarii]MYZ44225.1 hypothetical protein [Achromobacter aestuarii]